MVDSQKLSLIGIYLSVFTHSLMYSVYFPVSNLMMTEFDKAESRSKTGESIGKISCWHLIGEFLSFPLFIWLMGRFSCKLLLLFSIVTTSLLALYLASSNDYDALLVIRFLQGLLCPVQLVAGRALSGFFPRSPNRVPAFIQRFALIGLAAGFMIGGAWHGESFLGESKYLKSGFGVFVCGILSFALCFLYLKDEGCADKTSFLRIFIETVQILKAAGVVQVGLVFMLCCAGKSVLELMVIWAWALLDDGGFNIKLTDLWKIMSLACLLVFAYIFLYCQQVVSKLGDIQAVKDCSRVCSACLLTFPIFSMCNFSYTGMYVLLILGSFLYFTSLAVSLNALQSIVSKVSAAKEGVQVTDVILALGKISQALAVSSVCSNFSKNAQKSKDYPFNFAAGFNILALVLLLAYFFCFFLSDELRQLSVSQVVPSHESLLEPSLEVLEIPVKSNELRPMTRSK